MYFDHPTPRPSSPAHAGDPVRCGLSIPSPAPLEYWVVRSSRTMTTEWICVPQPTHPRALAARCARGLHSVSPFLEKEGRRESRAPIAPAVVHKKRTSGPQVNRIIRLSLRDGLRLIRDLPGDRAFLPPSPCGLTDASQARLGRTASPQDLTPASGRQDHTISPSAPVLAKALAGPRTHPASFVEDSFQRRSSARRPIAHGVQSALRSLARPTLSRPSHPTARS